MKKKGKEVKNNLQNIQNIFCWSANGSFVAFIKRGLAPFLRTYIKDQEKADKHSDQIPLFR